MTRSEELVNNLRNQADLARTAGYDVVAAIFQDAADHLLALEAVRTATEKWVTKIQTEGTAIEEYNTLTVALAAVKEKEIKWTLS